MAIITFLEVIYLLITTFVVGFIFSGYIPIETRISNKDEVLSRYEKKRFFDWEAIKFTMLVAAPGVVLHELSHKFLALLFGMDAVFKIFWFGLGIGFLLKLISSPFLILAPGYVEISGISSSLELTSVAFAGPFVNLVLWLGSWYLLKNKKKLSTRSVIALALTKQINMMLFIFNMLPIPPLDGYKVWTGFFNFILP